MRYRAPVMRPGDCLPASVRTRPRNPVRKLIGLAWLGVSVLAAPADAAPPVRAAPASAAVAPARFTVQGLAPASAGMTLAQAEQVLGQPLLPEKPAAPNAASAPAASGATPAAAASPACHYRNSARLPGVRFVLREGRLVRSETRDARYATASGLHVGDTLAKAEQLYGKRLESSRHPYFDHGRTLAIYAGDRKHALVMETNDQGAIITLRAGRVPEVLALEGCPA